MTTNFSCKGLQNCSILSEADCRFVSLQRCSSSDPDPGCSTSGTVSQMLQVILCKLFFVLNRGVSALCLLVSELFMQTQWACFFSCLEFCFFFWLKKVKIWCFSTWWEWILPVLLLVFKQLCSHITESSYIGRTFIMRLHSGAVVVWWLLQNIDFRFEKLRMKGIMAE